MQKAGGSWGARPNIIFKAITVMNEFMECTPELTLTSQDIAMQVSFDEFNLDVTIKYQGKNLIFPERKPSKELFLTDYNGSHLVPEILGVHDLLDF